MIYICKGSHTEKLDWFRIINIAGEKLNDQELRNAIYTGEWLSDAKKYFSKNQKGLNNDERLRNARNSLIPNSKIDIKGRTVVIIDDVVTTGASLSACARAIKSLGAKKIICLSVTKTFEKNE